MGINQGKTPTVFTTLTVDSTTLDIDEVNNRVGIGTNAPGTALQIETTAPYVTLKNTTAENSDGGCESKIIFEDHANATLSQVQGSHDGSSDDTKGNVIISTNNGSSLVEGMRIDSTQKATFAGDVTVTGDIIIDDGGSIKEAGGTAAITIDASGNVTKIGQDSFSSGDVVTWDGAKFVGEAPTTGDITGVTAGDGLTGGGTTGGVTLNIGAGTGIDVAADAISVDVSDFMTNGADNRIVTATGTDAMNAEANLSFDGSTLSVTGAISCSTDLSVNGGDLEFGNGQNATVKIGDTAHNAVGKNLTLTAGKASAGTTNNIAGGGLVLQSGQGKGSAAGGDITFQISSAGGSGSSHNSHATIMTVSPEGLSMASGKGILTGTVAAADGQDSLTLANSTGNATFAADVTVTGDIILDDGGSLKEAGGTAAITFDGSGNVTKIGQDSPSNNDVLQWDGAKWVANAVSGGGSGAVSAVANGADNRVATFSSSDALNGESGLTYDGSTLAITGDATVSGGDITYGNGQNATLGITATAHNAAGKSLTISGGAPAAGTTNNIAGGDLVLAGGQGKGTGSSGNIKFQIANSAAGAGSTLNALADAMVLDDLNTLTIKRDVDSEFTALKLYNQSDSADTNGKVTVQFSLEDTGGNEVDAAKIVCEKQQSFTATAGTQDAKLAFWLSHDGTITERMTLSSAGDLATDGDITAGGAIYASEFMYHTGDTDTKIQFTADQINLLAGNVNMLKLKETTQNEAVFFEAGDDVDFRIEAASAAYFFYINSGDNKLFVGGNTANKLTDQMFNVQDGNIAMGKNSADAAGPELIFAKSRHATDGSHTIVQDGDIIGEIAFKGSDGSSLQSSAAVTVQVDGTPGSSDMPGKLIFKTTRDGQNTPSDALTITATQAAIFEKSIVAKGTYDDSAGTASYTVIDYLNTGGRIISRGVNDTTKGTFTIVTEATDFNPTNNAMVIANDNDVTFLGTVTDGSDLKLKTDVRNLDSMIPIINQLRPIKYKKTYKLEANERSTADYYGFIAQEVQPLLPDIVHSNVDTDFQGNPTGTVTLSLAYTEMVPILTKCIQEQQELIEALTARVTALEG